MKLWLLDADVIIKLLELDVFDRLAAQHEVHVASTVVDEVKYYRREGQKVRVDFRAVYILPGRVSEASATAERGGYQDATLSGRLGPVGFRRAAAAGFRAQALPGAQA